MTEPRIREIVRNFPENGLKLLLEDPLNLREVLVLDQYPHVDRLDFGHVELDRTTYIQPDFRHVMTDLVYHIPFRRGKGGGAAAEFLTVYLLLEYQSEPDEWAALWLLGYLSAIYVGQHRTALAQGQLKPGWQLQPVLPVVLYTGNRSWDDVKPLAELVAGSRHFGPELPNFAPRFVNIDRLSEQELDERSTGFGHVLWLLRHRLKQTGFAPMLTRTVRRLEQLRSKQRLRWLELLSYLNALVYHGREEAEGHALQQVIYQAAQSDPARQEVQEMGKTYAMVLEERGRIIGRQEALLRLLKKRFRSVPDEIVDLVQQTQDVGKLDKWLDQCVEARRLNDVGIRANA